MGKLKYLLFGLLVICIIGIVGTVLLDEENPSNASSGPINPDWEPAYIDEDAGSPIDTTYSYAKLVDEISPAVVSIITKTIDYDMFLQPYPTEGAGTGVIIDPSGYIVTNNHVIEDATSVTVVLSNGDELDALKWVGDSETDLAMIEIAGDGYPYAHFLEDSLDKLKKGDKVMAMGNAGGRGIASTEGTISFLGEAIQIDDEILYNLVRTSAAINPGNSGGPLVNMAGQVIGINVAINPDYENFGYAISTNTAIQVIEYLVKEGNVPPTWLGVYIQDIDDISSIFKSDYNISADTGAVIIGVVSNSPAEDAGLQTGDVITKFGSQVINTSEELITAIRNHDPGDTVTITFKREEDTLTTTATLGQNSSS